MENTGFLSLPPRFRDWQSGGITGIEYQELNPTSQWEQYLSQGEDQRNPYFDTMGCVSWSYNNVCEAQLNLRIAMKLLGGGKYTHDQNLQWLKENGYIMDGKVRFSNRDLTVMSGTSENGNYLVVVADTARYKDGKTGHGQVPLELVPDQLDSITNRAVWYQYKRSEEVEKIAVEFLKRFDSAYEWIYAFNPFGASPAYPTDDVRYHLKQAPLQIAGPICSPWNGGGVVAKCAKTAPEHAVTLIHEAYVKKIEDHYKPYRKSLSADYYLPYVLKIIIQPKTEITMSDQAKKLLATCEKKLVLAAPSGRNAYVKGGVALDEPNLPADATEADKRAYRSTLMSFAILRENGFGFTVPDALFDEWEHKPF